LTDKNQAMVNLPWPQISDVLVVDSTVYVASQSNSADSILAFSFNLVRQKGIYTAGPGMKMASCSKGLFAETFVINGISTRSNKLLFWDPKLSEIVGK